MEQQVWSRRRARQSTLRPRVAAITRANEKSYAGVINIVSYGYHQYDRDPRPDFTRDDLETYLKDHRERELTGLKSWVPYMHEIGLRPFVMTVGDCSAVVSEESSTDNSPLRSINATDDKRHSAVSLSRTIQLGGIRRHNPSESGMVVSSTRRVGASSILVAVSKSLTTRQVASQAAPGFC